MVQFKDLANTKGKRKIREIIFAEGETIRVFEPDEDDIRKIVEMQEDFMNEENPERLQLGGREVIKMFSMFTDIEGFDDLTDEEIEHVTNNPSIALFQAQHAIEGIVTEVYKMVILSMKNRILETDLRLESSKVSKEVLERQLRLTEKDGTNPELVAKIDEARKKLAEVQSQHDEARGLESEEEEKSEPKPKVETKQIGKHDNVLAMYRSTFGEPEETEE